MLRRRGRVRRPGGASPRAGRRARRAHALAASPPRRRKPASVEQPVAAGREHEVLGARAAQLARDLVALGRRGAGEALAHRAAGRVDLQLAPGLRVDEPQLARGRELLLARVADLDRERPVAAAQRAQRIGPVARAAEVGDDDDEPALAGGGRACGAGRRRPTSRPAPSASGSARSSGSSASRPRRPCWGRSDARPAAAEADDPRAGCRAGWRRARSRARRPRRRRPCAGRRCRTSSRPRCRAPATSSAPARRRARARAARACAR